MPRVPDEANGDGTTKISSRPTPLTKPVIASLNVELAKIQSAVTLLGNAVYSFPEAHPQRVALLENVKVANAGLDGAYQQLMRLASLSAALGR